jgi:hypothetical protein
MAAGTQHHSARSEVFNAGGDAYMAAGKVCGVGDRCYELEANGIGWLEPGSFVGAE